ncbi:glycosyltransferase family 9 protein [Aequorivita capsosiphonis]|uniref:glycosyltransferase family 9 protein n=1 Tax=Aequorivita capsosiphonis TaxID=487317 RepID=UPI000401783D|nr:glycosyltransferase family 9 protein [Aequorivita capsosiphonis]
MKKILVIQNKRIGDVLISSVIANNIKKVFPKSEVTYFVYEYTAGVLENNPNIDRIIAVKENELKNYSTFFQTILDINRENFDIIFDPYSKLQSRLMCLFSRAEYRIGLKRAHKELKFPFYTHPISLLENRSKTCGKAIEDRINMITSVFELIDPEFTPKIYLTEEENNYNRIDSLQRPIIMLGILGSTPQKSMPYEYMVEIIDFITKNYQGTVLFNYMPDQKAEALKVYEMCEDKDQINLDIYEDNIRGFIKLINKCDLLVSNEGGSVHITKAVNTPTFTIYSPYVNKEHWSSFEDENQHDSIHLLEEKPDLFSSFTLEERRSIEEDPNALYKELTPEMILSKLKPFLEHHLKTHSKT